MLCWYSLKSSSEKPEINFNSGNPSYLKHPLEHLLNYKDEKGLSIELRISFSFSLFLFITYWQLHKYNFSALASLAVVCEYLLPLHSGK